MAQVIMVGSGKGGTGKSTFSTYLATELAMNGKKTLLTELDVGLRSIDVISGTIQQAVYDIGDVLSHRVSPKKAIIQSPYSPNLHIIPAPYKNTEIDFNGFKQIIDGFYTQYDYIIIDTAAGLGKAFKAACSVANHGIIVITPDAVSVRDGRIAGDEMFACGIKDIGLIINKFSKSTFKYSGYEDIDAIIDETQCRLLGLIPTSETIASCAIKGQLLPRQSQEKQIFKAISDRLQDIQRQIIIQ